MKQIAIISDIHSNLPALESVLKEIDRRKIQKIICLGDIIGKGPSPNEVIDICMEKCLRVAKGNHEELICSKTVFGGEIYGKIKDWHLLKIGTKRLEYLQSLENSIDIVMGGRRIRLFHASQISALNRVHKNDAREKHLLMFENTEFTGYRNKPNIVGYGDIHSSYIEILDDRILFNVGSVGNPLGLDTRASFGIINDGNENKLFIEIVKIEYNKIKALEDAKKSDLPEIELYINEIETGKYRNRS